MSFTGFVHLQCQSEYSVKNSLIRVSKLIESVKESGMSSVALTDDMSLFSAVKFYQKATKEGIKPIIGSKLSVTFEFGTYEVLVLCQNHKGYLNLSELISKAYLGEQGISIATINEKQLISHNEGLIMIAPLVTSDISKLFLSGKLEIAEEKAKSWESVFNSRYYMAVKELIDHLMKIYLIRL